MIINKNVSDIGLLMDNVKFYWGDQDVTDPLKCTERASTMTSLNA